MTIHTTEIEMITKSKLWIAAQRAIVEAETLASDRSACIAHANRVCRAGLRRGMWRSVQAKARKTLRLAALNGLTPAHPVVIRDGMAYGIFGGELCPLYRMTTA